MLRTIPIAMLLFAFAMPTENSAVPQLRLTPAEIIAMTPDTSQSGGAGAVAGGRKTLFGDPAKPGFYAILLFVPAHTTIPAHSHRDDRSATVISGEWHFGYGDHFDASALKTLPPGSVYSEPAGINHFAQTGDQSVVVEIAGYGPSDNRFATEGPRP
jgi:quercetin dioxygenase-like cupin family protein